MLDTPRTVRGVGAGDLSRRSAADNASAKGSGCRWGGAGRNFMPDATGLACELARRRAEEAVEPRARREATRRFSSRADASTRCRPLGLLSAGAAQPRKKSSPRSMPPAARRSGSSSIPRRPTVSISRRALVRTRRRSSSATGFTRPSTRKELFALDKATGQRVWAHDFMKEYIAPSPGRGYTCSPILYNGTIIVTVGGPGQAIAAFNQQTGALVWKSRRFRHGASVADPDRRGRPAAAGAVRGRARRRAESGERPDALEPRPQDRLGPEHQHAGMVADGPSAVHLLGVRQREPRDWSCTRRPATRRRPRSGSTSACASTSARSCSIGEYVYGERRLSGRRS